MNITIYTPATQELCKAFFDANILREAAARAKFHAARELQELLHKPENMRDDQDDPEFVKWLHSQDQYQADVRMQRAVELTTTACDTAMRAMNNAIAAEQDAAGFTG